MVHDPFLQKLNNQIIKLNETFDNLTFRSVETEFLDTLRVYNKAWEPPISNNFVGVMEEISNKMDKQLMLLSLIDDKLKSVIFNEQVQNVNLSKIRESTNQLTKLFNEDFYVKPDKDTGGLPCLRVWNKKGG